MKAEPETYDQWKDIRQVHQSYSCVQFEIIRCGCLRYYSASHFHSLGLLSIGDVLSNGTGLNCSTRTSVFIRHICSIAGRVFSQQSASNISRKYLTRTRESDDYFLILQVTWRTIKNLLLMMLIVNRLFTRVHLPFKEQSKRINSSCMNSDI